jgi:hypothetical protein
VVDYYLAPSLAELRSEINAAHPARDKSSDGWIGDASHAARASDHNPDWNSGGVVRALDVDKDGIDTAALLATAIRDPRVEYVIWQRRIYQRNRNFVPQAYNGTNPHDKHMHISLQHTKAAEAATAWGYRSGGAPTPVSTAGNLLPLDQVARQVIAGAWGNGDDRARRLRAKGYDPVAVQAEVNRQKTGTPAPARKSVDEIVSEVLAGKWGNGPDRSQRLQAAGYSPTEVQNGVNARLGGARPAAVGVSIEVIADQVIRNQWGSGQERVRRLTAAGYNAAAVQAEVNRRLA